MKCTNCGEQVPNDAVICGHCGHQLRSTPAPQPVYAAASPPPQAAQSQGIPGWVWGVGCGVIFLIAVVALVLLGFISLGGIQLPGFGQPAQGPAPTQPVANAPAPQPTVAQQQQPTAIPTTAPTNTSSVVMASVSVDTNCRAGPGIPYDIIGAVLVGEKVEVVGKSTWGDYWIVKNPDDPGLCWLWGEYATLTGNVGGLASMTPPASPTSKPQASITVNPYSGPIPTTYNFTLKNFLPNEKVDIDIIYKPTSAIVYSTTVFVDANGSGSFGVVSEVTDPSGIYRVIADGADASYAETEFKID